MTDTSLIPAKLQKLTVDDDLLTIEVFAGGRRLIQIAPGRFAVDVERTPRADGPPPAVQGLVRKELSPGVLSAVDVDADAGLTTLSIKRPDGSERQLVIEADGRDPRWLVLQPVDGGRRILAAVPGVKPRDGRDTRRGRLYEPPRQQPAAMPTADVGVAVGAAGPRIVDEQLHTLRARLRSEHERLRRLLKALERDVEKHGRGGGPDALLLQGEYLKPHLSRLPRGASAVEVDDGVGGTVHITLDPARSGVENLNAIFARARRARAGLSHLEPRLAAATERARAVAALRARLAVDGLDDHDPGARADAERFLLAVRDEDDIHRVQGSARRRAAIATGRRLPWRSFRVTDDVVVRVGRGARDNDALVKSARGHDLWLHARDRTGAHVIIPSSGGEVPEAVFLDAATLAAWFSAARGERHVDIQHTRVKHLRKPGAGAPAGLFLVANEGVLHLRVDEDRVQRLLAAEVAAPAS